MVELFTVLLATASLVVSLICVAIVAGFTRSTHQVQYVPHDLGTLDPLEEIASANKELITESIGRKRMEKTKLQTTDELSGLNDV